LGWEKVLPPETDASGGWVLPGKEEKKEKQKKQKGSLLLLDLFRTTHKVKVKTQQVVKSRGQHCGDIELGGYLSNEAGPVSLVLDLRVAHDRVGSSDDPALNGHLRYPNN
jgi:hypothetical protein